MTSPSQMDTQRRKKLQEHAASLNIDDAYISLLVDDFYTRIHGHEIIGPIFKQAIGQAWDKHLMTMKSFWASVSFGDGRYSGQPVPKHRALVGIEEQHFDIWLSLFEQTLKDTAPNDEVPPFFMERANRIAQSLKLAIFGIPSLPKEYNPQ